MPVLLNIEKINKNTSDYYNYYYTIKSGELTGNLMSPHSVWKEIHVSRAGRAWNQMTVEYTGTYHRSEKEMVR